MRVPFVDLGAQYAAHKPELDAALAGIIENSAFIGGAAVRPCRSPTTMSTIPAGCATEAKLDFADGDYRLQPGSPAVGAGAVVSGIIAADFTGAPFAIPPSIGAYEIP